VISGGSARLFRVTNPGPLIHLSNALCSDDNITFILSVRAFALVATKLVCRANETERLRAAEPAIGGPAKEPLDKRPIGR
jgi:hypothetical protein